MFQVNSQALFPHLQLKLCKCKTCTAGMDIQLFFFFWKICSTHQCSFFPTNGTATSHLFHCLFLIDFFYSQPAPETGKKLAEKKMACGTFQGKLNKCSHARIFPGLYYLTKHNFGNMHWLESCAAQPFVNFVPHGPTCQVFESKERKSLCFRKKNHQFDLGW